MEEEREWRTVFFWNSYEGLNKLTELLEKEGIEAYKDSFIGYGTIIVPKEEYEKSLVLGTKLANENNIDVCWVGKDSYAYGPLNYLPVMINVPTEKNRDAYERPSDVQLYLDYLSNYLGNREVLINEYGRRIFIKGSFDEFDDITEKTKEFNKECTFIPFEEIGYTNMYNVITEEEYIFDGKISNMTRKIN